MNLLNLFRTPTIQQIATAQLKEAELSLLDALAHRERADGIVHFRQAQITRLQLKLAQC